MDAAFSTEMGSLHSSVIEVEVQGEKYYMIFRKDEAREAYQRPLSEEDVRKNVIRKTERDRRDALMKEWKSKLRERAEVKTFIDRIPEDEVPEQKAETPSEETAPEK
jgi:hypothetical protein